MFNQKKACCRFIGAGYLLGITLLVAGILTTTSFAKSPGTDVTIGGNSISVTGQPSLTFMQLRVAGPDGVVIFDQKSDGSPITWSVPGEAGDGFYSWEVRSGREAKKEGRGNDRTRGLGPRTRAMVDSGSVLIKDGAIVMPAEEETGLLLRILSTTTTLLGGIMDFLVAPAAADQVILDDLIVDGSICAGFDCVNGESFGFDTLRLKENNLRIKFQDTSNSASFPSNDWQITANDSSNGGKNKFSIDDIDGGRTPFTIEASAPSHSLYVEDDGDVGLGTSTPVVELHIIDGDTPTTRLEQDGSSGFTPQTWDVAGNETNFFIRDATNGSTLPFRIQPGAASNTLYISNNDYVGIGTASPNANLHIDDNVALTSAQPLFKVENNDHNVFTVENSGQVNILGDPANAAEDYLVRVGIDNDDTGAPDFDKTLFWIKNSGDAYLLGNLELGSSRSYKENIYDVSLQEALEALKELSPVHFNYRRSPDVNSLGFIAEDVPDLVAGRDRKSLRPMDIITVLTKVTQEQQKTIEELSIIVSQLQAEGQAVQGSM